MMCPSRKQMLPGFTLVEMLVMITLSCFFVFMVYSTVHLFNVAYHRDKASQQLVGAIWTLEGSLLHDTNEANLLIGSQSDSLLVCIMPIGDTVIYHFHRGYLLRTQGSRNDTLPNGCLDLNFSYNGWPVDSGVIDQMEMKTKYKQGEQLMQFDKNYTPAELFNLLNIPKLAGS